MTKIMIPKCRNPFVVIMNGIRYEYESGKEIEVPDEVAAIIQFHVDSKPKAKPYVGGGGVCNRPHVYFSDGFDKLPTDAVDGSLVVVETPHALFGTWVLPETIPSMPYWGGTLYFTSNDTDFIGFSGYGSLSYDNGTGSMQVYSNGAWLDDAYRTMKITGAGTQDTAPFENWLNTIGTQTEAGVAHTLYSRQNGEWVNQGEVDFTDLASS